MDKTIKITYSQNNIKQFTKDTTLKEISEKFQKNYNFKIIGAQVNNRILGLSDTVSVDANAKFFDRSSTIGNTIYSRSATFILVLAVNRLYGKKTDVKIEHSIDKGIYCEILGNKITKKDIKNLENEMFQIVNENHVFEKISVDRIEAIEYFKKNKQYDKVDSLKYISNNTINLFKLQNIYDYFYSELAYSTGDIDEFNLTYIKDNGFVLSYPSPSLPDITLDYIHRKNIFDEFLDYTRWGETIGITTSADLNKTISSAKHNDMILLAETHYNNQLASIANQIKETKTIKLILIAGPSSSGKTTTSRKLAVYLKSVGLNPHQISLDNYFYPLDKTPKNVNGDYNFETIKALDLNLFNKHLTSLLDGTKVKLPEYNFKTGKREFNDNYLEIKENDIIIIEGIHGLNEQLTQSIDRLAKFKIYISPLTQLNIDNHNRIHTSDTRRLRRIIRDSRTRGYTASDTLNMWESIRAGEEKYIYPYQDEADAIVNSSLIYELGVLKVYAEPLLFSVKETDENYPEAIRLINFLRSFLPMPSDEVPKDSVLREFIGGSYYHE